MQIIEATVIGVRSALLRLQGGPEAPSFTLFPMLHIAEQRFYDEVTRRLEKHDLVLYEGVQLKPWSAWLLTHYYDGLAKRLGLVTQHMMKLSHLRDRLMHADVSGDEFERQWSRVGLSWRAAFWMAAPIAGLYFMHFATRHAIARYLGLNLLKSRDEILRTLDEDPIEGMILTRRDRHLINIIEAHRRPHRAGPFSIAIVYGAAHMRAVIHHLTRSPEPGYRVVKGEWMTVFTL